MWTARDYLTQECVNLGEVLRETLRFKYGSDGSREFFEECEVRLQFIKAELASVEDSSTRGLAKLNELIGDLSGLVARIERSSVDAYSWPFVEQLKKIAIAACSEATLANPRTPPKVHVLSEGGLDAYWIYPEPARPTASKKRILTIVVPRTLKNFVLLHAILGHELGHAMYSLPQQQRTLTHILRKHLTSTGHFADATATARWLYSDAAPDSIKLQLKELLVDGIDEQNFFPRVADWDAWVEEILCDFVGLMTFGPSFLAATCNLLYAVDPGGLGIGLRHPPAACRVNYLLVAATETGMDRPQYQDAALSALTQTFWQTLQAKRISSRWLDVFSAEQVKGAAESMGQFLASFPPAAYVQPNEDVLASLVSQLQNSIPPVGFSIGADLSFNYREVDFRHVLYAGWIASTIPDSAPFDKLNRLCEHAILQQMAIDLSLKANPNVSSG